MKRTLLFLASAMFVGVSSFAQNTYPWVSPGNIGIGTQTPSNTLNVDPQGAGGITIGNSSVFTGGYTSLQFNISAALGGYSTIQSIKSTGSTSGVLALNANGGNVGIGTTTPTGRFTVVSPSSSTLLGLPTIADFISSGNIDRARITIANNFNYPSKNASSAIVFAGYNLAGTGLEPKWEMGTDYSLNGGRNLYFYNTATLNAPLFLSANGSVGIAATSPVSMFQVEDGFEKTSIGPASGSLVGTGYLGFNAARSGSSWTVNADPSHNGGGVIYGDIFGNINFVPIADIGYTTQTLTDATVKSKIAFQIAASGLVRAKQIKVETANWPDFVFSKTYKLQSLNSLELYIDKNHHLPDMPSAKSIETSGLDLGEMNRLLLKKVEELTLYVIANERKDNEKDKVLASLQQQLNELKNAKRKFLKENYKKNNLKFKKSQK